MHLPAFLDFPAAGAALGLTLLVGSAASEAAGEPGPWLQLGLGGAALFLVWSLGKPLVVSLMKANERVAAAMERQSEILASMGETMRQILVSGQQHATILAAHTEEDAKAAAALTASIDRIASAAGIVQHKAVDSR
jgi:hypothetical protein